jgi:predicted dehydrogenase
MQVKRKINVAVIGLEFGSEFVPIYLAHPSANMYAICQRTKSHLDKVGDAFGIHVRYTDYNELLKDPAVDAIHINTPPYLHAEHVVAALEAGKHVACTIPMALSVEDCKKIVETAKKTGKKYMMMETVVYSREFLFVKDLYDKGELGRIQFYRSSHQQEMLGWPAYWEGFPPMYNATHAISPTLALRKDQAEWVECIGSGRIQQEMVANYGSPFAIESSHIQFKDTDVGAEVTRSLFNTARQYRESFDVHGSKKTFEWTQIQGEHHVIHTGETPERVEVPDYACLLPKEIRPFTTGGVYDAKDNAHRSFVQGGGHGGSHPHLAHEFLSALVEEREPYPNARQAANITCAGILSHASAMSGGSKIYLPDFTIWK